MDVIIVGAGPTGLTLGAALARRRGRALDRGELLKRLPQPPEVGLEPAAVGCRLGRHGAET